MLVTQVDLSVDEAYCIGVGFAKWLRQEGEGSVPWTRAISVPA